jgi:EAL domain-containing protein (putative c-di-GMP-specific phosphodiesterase class I)
MIKNDLITEKIVNAIKNKEVYPVYQPIRHISENNGKFKKFEVLARLCVDGNLISPPQFISIAKDNNLYEEITKQIVKVSFDYFYNLKVKKSLENFKFSINIQMLDIESQEVIEFISEKLSKFDLADNLIFELTEEDFLTDSDKIEKTKKFITIFKEKGCEFALDDFGNGYSTFSPLIHFNLDYLKFDKILVKNLFDEPKQFYICDLLVDFAKRNNLKIVAEYVECKKHEKALEAIGVEYYQGFLYEKNLCKNIDKFI